MKNQLSIMFLILLKKHKTKIAFVVGIIIVHDIISLNYRVKHIRSSYFPNFHSTFRHNVEVFKFKHNVYG